MNLSKKATTIVIVVATISLVGLSLVQFQWLDNSIKLNRSIFYQKVDLASELIGEETRQNTALLREIVRKLADSTQLSVRTHHAITEVIDSALDAHNITARYTYGLYQHANGHKEQYRWAGGTAVDSTLTPGCHDQVRSFGWANLTCGQAAGHWKAHYHLGLFFPNADLYLLSSMKGTLLTTLLFISLLVISFAYTVLTIQKQKKLSEMKNDFINNLTHEFKTPIFSIDLAAGMLKKAPELQKSEKLLKYVDVIDSEGQRLKNQVDKVLQMALIDSGNFRLEKKDLDIHHLIQKVVDNVTLHIKERGGAIMLHLQAQKSWLYADETHINNVLYNLLDNAQKYSTEAPQITVTTHDEPDSLKVSIRDSGIGINRPMQQYIFDKFYRGTTSDVHDIKGFGLGLSYAKSVIEAHNAKISLISTPRAGSTFTLTFGV